MPSYGREMAGKFLHFFIIVCLNRWRCKVHAKTKKSAFREIFVARYIPILQYLKTI